MAINKSECIFEALDHQASLKPARNTFIPFVKPLGVATAFNGYTLEGLPVVIWAWGSHETFYGTQQNNMYIIVGVRCFGYLDLGLRAGLRDRGSTFGRRCHLLYS